jgi:hypothetical protein
LIHLLVFVIVVGEMERDVQTFVLNCLY